MGINLSSRVGYLVERARVLDLASVVERAKQTARQHSRCWPVVLGDMLLESFIHGTNFQDYLDWDFAILKKAERRTYLTNAISAHIVAKYNDPEYFDQLENKIKFNERFGEFLHREWFVVTDHSAEELREFVTRQGKVIAKVPVSNSGYGVDLYRAEEVDDWEGFREFLVKRDQTLLEEYIVQHEDLMAVAPGTVNTTRVTTFLHDGEVEVVSFAQKFGVGSGASDQQAFGGFFVLLDENGRAISPGYGSHQHIYGVHPETGASIPDFQLPETPAVLRLCAELALTIPEIPYIAWDVVVTPEGPIIVEGNRTPGAYENKPSATGIWTGSLPRIREYIDI
ncbi:sugar-transfer associated ATP-grasp domain-containing protein [Gulosibacter sp. 10]|uniref:sugar-transfer associated ATP-grasp domain-containing protein n=1 Tax=Gulosibacter sp. 10 TaxID=1255570 RepID=UPI00097EECDA|nr:sugar-transfer associated ATP-grasp domain-containing protein [Gulosibacter sp. 10]SJM52674.1 putative hexapeptide transferase family protein [Gulosibacter sp. 10]